MSQVRLGAQLVCISAAALALCACSGNQRITIDGAAPFSELPMRMDSSRRTHIAIFEAPTAGWRVERDLMRRAFRVSEVFVTLRRPGPGEMMAQVISEHAVDTGVDSTQNVAVYARVATGRDSAQGMSYRLAGEATPNPPAR